MQIHVDNNAWAIIRKEALDIATPNAASVYRLIEDVITNCAGAANLVIIAGV